MLRQRRKRCFRDRCFRSGDRELWCLANYLDIGILLVIGHRTTQGPEARGCAKALPSGDPGESLRGLEARSHIAEEHGDAEF